MNHSTVPTPAPILNPSGVADSPPAISTLLELIHVYRPQDETRVARLRGHCDAESLSRELFGAGLAELPRLSEAELRRDWRGRALLGQYQRGLEGAVRP